MTILPYIKTTAPLSGPYPPARLDTVSKQAIILMYLHIRRAALGAVDRHTGYVFACKHVKLCYWARRVTGTHPPAAAYVVCLFIYLG